MKRTEQPKIANMDNICGNAFKISNICRTAFLPRNRYLENAYAAVTAVPIATTIVPTLSIAEFFSQSKMVLPSGLPGNYPKIGVSGINVNPELQCPAGTA